MIQTKTHRKHLYTPLRYPGGKTSLFQFFDKVITTHDWQDTVYVEPYAGGAGAAISLLLLDRVKSIVINDYDPAVYAFWRSLLDHADEFIKKIESTPVTIEEWHKQKRIYSACDQSQLLELGFATFYLNRTNRSGILSAGPVGGKSQAGKWKLDARYNKQNLIEKIKLIAAHKDRIEVTNLDGVDVIRKYSRRRNVFFYIDPPYYQKGAILYLNHFDHQHHVRLADTLRKYADKRWILSYDNAQPIKDMYQARGFDPEIFTLNYSAHPQSRSGMEIMIFSNQIDTGLLTA